MKITYELYKANTQKICNNNSYNFMTKHEKKYLESFVGFVS